MNVLVFTFGDLETGSTKYRIVQYKEYLEKRGIRLQFLHRNRIDRKVLDYIENYDLVINQKCLFDVSLERKIAAKAKRLIFDFDDAIWTRPGKPFSTVTQLRVNTRLKFWLRNSDIVICANNYLSYYAKQYSERVRVLPMALDLKKWHPVVDDADDSIVRIGWAGSPVNLIHLEKLDPLFHELSKRHANYELKVYCGKMPNLTAAFSYVPFEVGTEPKFVRGLDIGLLPLEDGDFHRGKSPIKAIQYLASGVALIGNSLGATAEIMRPEHGVSVENDWLEKLSKLIDDSETRKSMISEGLDFVKEHHNAIRCQEALFDIISELFRSN